MKIQIFFILLTTLLYSCSKKDKNEHEMFFDKVFKSIRYNSIEKEHLNWTNIESKVKDSIKVFNSSEDVYSAIECTLHFIKDKHGFFLRPKNNFLLNDSLSIPEIKTNIVGKKIGYIKIEGFGANDSLSKLYALKIRKSFKNLDNSSNLSGWIIDLSDDFGGRLSSQCLGISPLFKDSIIGYTKNNKGNFKATICSENYFRNGSESIQTINFDSTLKNKNKKVAVLMSSKTASLGEFLVLALKSQGNAKIFGTKSSGLTTGLKYYSFPPSRNGFSISDSYFCDLNKNAINGKLSPDIKCSPEKSIEEAIKWIENNI